jgi:hypothetical protein
MDLSTENLLFIRALFAHIDRLRELAGAEWPAFRDRLIELSDKLEHAANSAQTLVIVDDIISVGLSSPASDLIRALLNQARVQAGQPATPTRFVPMFDPTSGQSRNVDVDLGSNGANVSPADVAAASRALAKELRADTQRVSMTATAESPYLNTRFDGIGPEQLLPVGQRVPLILWVGDMLENNHGQSSRPFDFTFPDKSTAMSLLVRIDADPDTWIIEIVQPTMKVVPPKATQQEAVFVLTARQPGRDKIHISVERNDTGVIVQHVWLTVEAAPKERLPPTATKTDPIPSHSRQAVDLPYQSSDITERSVQLTIHAGRDSESFTMVVHATFPDRIVHEVFTVPISGVAVQNATLRLRQELNKIVRYQTSVGGQPTYPFADAATLTVEEQLARQATVPLADAGYQVWDLLFRSPRAPEGLRLFADTLRSLPHDSMLQIVIDSQQFIVPWALLYDRPGQITSETLDWHGFWGYRYLLDVLPPGQYPPPTIADVPLGLQLLFNDDDALRESTTAQEKFARHQLGHVHTQVARGMGAVEKALADTLDAALVYFFCHGTHANGAVQAGMLPSESALYFSEQKHIRLIDLKRLVASRLAGKPLVFLNTCQGAAQDAFYYDGFMPFFIEERGARGFISAEVEAPQPLAHDFALRFLHAFAEGEKVGTILTRLRRFYLDSHNTILAFNYSLYGLGEIRLAIPLLQRIEGEESTNQLSACNTDF